MIVDSEETGSAMTGRFNKIGEQVVYDDPRPHIEESKRAAAVTKYAMQYTSVFIGPTRIEEEDRSREICPCPNTSNPWHVCGKWCRENMRCNQLCRKKKPKRAPKKKESKPQIFQAI